MGGGGGGGGGGARGPPLAHGLFSLIWNYMQTPHSGSVDKVWKQVACKTSVNE